MSDNYHHDYDKRTNEEEWLWSCGLCFEANPDDDVFFVTYNIEHLAFLRAQHLKEKHQPPEPLSDYDW